MKKINSAFMFSLILMLLSLAVLLYNRNSVQKWRYNYSLIGFSIFLIIWLASAYMAFFQKKK